MRTIVALLSLSLLIGCASEKNPGTDATSQSKTEPGVSTPAGSGGGVAPIAGGAAGGLSPVRGGESVDGAGMGSMGNIAKDRARTAAAGPASAPPTEEGQE